MISGWKADWQGASGRRRAHVVLAAVLGAFCVVAASVYMATGDGFSVVDSADPTRTYLGVFVLVALDAVVPVFPGETTLNAAATAAAQGTLDLLPIIVMGALGAIAGDSALFWLARRSAHRVEPQLARAKSNPKVREALQLMNTSAPVLIVAGRYVPGLRFVVNVTMGLSTITYRRFLAWSILGGAMWSSYTCLLAYKIGLSLGEYPLASVVISGLITTAAIAIVFWALRRHRDQPATKPDPNDDRALK
jgi:membrane protein DedA with SNARE-associated domain